MRDAQCADVRCAVAARDGPRAHRAVLQAPHPHGALLCSRVYFKRATVAVSIQMRTLIHAGDVASTSAPVLAC